MLDLYFKKPLFWDYLIGLIALTISYILVHYYIWVIPEESNASVSSDLANISLTSSGFILTLLTILITFKSGSNITKENYKKAESVFDLFFASALYFETVKHLKNCIKSLIIISIVGFSLKLGLIREFSHLMFFYNIFGLIIIVLTLWRCLLILSKILEMQKRE